MTSEHHPFAQTTIEPSNDGIVLQEGLDSPGMIFLYKDVLAKSNSLSGGAVGALEYKL